MSRQAHTARRALVAGATGGLGSAFVHALASSGYKVICAGRDFEKANALALQLGPGHTALQLDLTSTLDLTNAHDALAALTQGRLDVVINAVGGDIRKSFGEHTASDFQTMVDLNFLGPARLLSLCLPWMQTGREVTLPHPKSVHQFIQISGFLNGRVGFPFYSADVAMRSATRTLLESVQRELNLAGRRDVKLRLFSPAVADTEAERPFLPLWRKMGVEAVAPEAVGKALLRFIDQKQQVASMGGLLMKALSILGDISPLWTDQIWLNAASKEMVNSFGSLSDSPSTSIQDSTTCQNA